MRAGPSGKSPVCACQRAAFLPAPRTCPQVHHPQPQFCGPQRTPLPRQQNHVLPELGTACSPSTGEGRNILPVVTRLCSGQLPPSLQPGRQDPGGGGGRQDLPHIYPLEAEEDGTWLLEVLPLTSHFTVWKLRPQGLNTFLDLFSVRPRGS